MDWPLVATVAGYVLVVATIVYGLALIGKGAKGPVEPQEGEEPTHPRKEGR